ncbi:MAG: hypothetical protein RR595_00445, partial [Lysinibacillus sp.]
MTSTSFNPIQMQQTAMPTNQPLTLKQGQVFQGTIKQLYPDQMAEIQIGGQKLFAKIEVPLKAGDSHFFQVTGTSPQTELKVVTGPMGPTASPTQQMNQLLESMNLPKTPEMQQVLSHFMKEQMPISKEQLMQAEVWMKNLPEGIAKQDALQAMQRMIELKMPFTNDVFQALLNGQKTSGMTSTLDVFAQALLKDAMLPEGLKQSLLQQVQSIAKPFEAETAGLVLAKSVQLLNNPSVPISVKLQVLNLMKEAGVVPKNANLQNWSQLSLQNTQNQQGQSGQFGQAGQIIQTIVATKPENTAQLVEQLKTWTANQSLLTNEQKGQIQQLLSRFSQLPQSQQAIEGLAKQMQDQLVKAFTANTPNRLFTEDANGLSTKDHLLSLIKPETTQQIPNETLLRNIVKVSNETAQPLIQNMLTQADAQVQSSMDSKAMEHAIKTVLKGLGVSYEAALNNKSADVQAIAHQLKPQLHTLLQDAQLTSQLREAADMLMHRMNGMQLSSGENGHQHQLIMQVPLEFFGKKMDATLQWNGRMKDDGKIDANYARILFYLQMESMQETVIDMQVQNRVLTVNIFNEHA